MDTVTDTLVFKKRKEEEKFIKEECTRVCSQYNINYHFEVKIIGFFKQNIMIEIKMTGNEKQIKKVKREMEVWTSNNPFLQAASLLHRK